MIIQSLWIGEFGTMEQMCVNSYARAGHEFHMYRYDPLEVPFPKRGEKVGPFYIKDANEIVPREKLGMFPSPSLFSDYFRYALLRAKGGWWVDMDTLCLKPFDDIDDEYVFARDNIDQFYISGCFLRAPLGSPLIEEALSITENIPQSERDQLGHMDIGPKLLQRLVPQYQLEKHVAEPYTFDPIPYNRLTRIVQPECLIGMEIDLLRHQPHAIHLRQSIWNNGENSCAGILPDGSKLMIDGAYPEDCLWSVLKKRFL